MKTKSISTIATLLSVAATLNLGALAGPGPQTLPQFAPRKVSEVQTRAVPIGRGDFKTVKTSAKPRAVVVATNAHGGLVVR